MTLYEKIQSLWEAFTILMEQETLQIFAGACHAHRLPDQDTSLSQRLKIQRFAEGYCDAGD